jgi:hypothetical protein
MRFFQTLLSRVQSSRPLPSQSSAPVMVVGMHRSGTSFLTGSLQQAGLELGSHSAWNPHNLKGNRENLEIVAFHDALLAARGCAWDNPPTERIKWTPDEEHQAKQLIADYQGVARWGFKDPRSLLVVDGWLELIPDLKFVGIFRHPTAVAQSLEARGGMPLEQALKLWKAYNEKLLQLHKLFAFPLLCFDEDEATLHDKLNIILQQMALAPLIEERFFSAELKHHQQQSLPLPREHEALYQELCACAR